MQGLGHNSITLRDRIFSDPEISVRDVLSAVSDHIQTTNKSDLESLTASATMLAGNKERLPEDFEAHHISSGLNLLAHMDAHSERAASARENMIADAESFVAELKASCKFIDEGISPLEKLLRSKITDHMLRSIDDHNAERSPTEEHMKTLTLRASGGAKATLSIGTDIEIESQEQIPREFCIPCPKLIAAAVKNGKNVPGIKEKRKPTLRITTK
jgi:hypothetical protein